MSDQTSPAVVKVGAPEAQAEGSTMDEGKINTATGPSVLHPRIGVVSLDAPGAAPEKPEQPEPPKPTESKETDAPAPAAAHASDKKPKPVTVQSVPETPANTANSINGTPRPELNLSEITIDPEKPSEDEAPAVTVERRATPPTSAPNTKESSTDKPVKPNGAPVTAEKSAALKTAQAEKGPELAGISNGKKRKLDDDAGDDASEDKRVKDKEGPDETDRANKKAKVETEAGAKPNGRHIKKPGRPKKDKSRPSVVGQTARKTRSQGPAEL